MNSYVNKTKILKNQSSVYDSCSEWKKYQPVSANKIGRDQSEPTRPKLANSEHSQSIGASLTIYSGSTALILSALSENNADFSFLSTSRFPHQQPNPPILSNVSADVTSVDEVTGYGSLIKD